jgi:hypothetical protein
VSLWGNKEKVPVLTRDAAKLSDALLALDEIGRQRAANTIAAIITGMTNLGAMPSDVVDHLWSIVITVARKALMHADPDKLMTEIKAGLDPDVQSLIMGDKR